MKTNKISNLDEWLFDKNISNNKRFAEISIHLKYPDIVPFLGEDPAERKKKIAEDQREKYDKLIATTLFDNYILIGSKNSPRGIHTKITFGILTKIAKLDFIGSIQLNNVDNATRIKAKIIPKFYCVKMTVVIEIEGQTSGFETIEERYVLIKAKSGDDAYKRIEKKKDGYEQPYLNSDGQLVKWRIESCDDYYETDLTNFTNLNSAEGVEVFSKLKRRKQRSKQRKYT
ncbi:MAG: DUF4288 domain-containing protein [Bacteroidota bacterium]